MDTITSLSPAFKKRLEQLTALKHLPALPHWGQQVDRLLNEFGQNLADLDTDRFLQILHESERVLKVYAAGVEDNESFLNALNKAQIPMWESYDAPPAEDKLQEALGDRLYNIDRAKGNPPYAIVRIGNQTRTIMPHVVGRLLEEDIPFDVDFKEPDFDHLLINHADNDGIKNLAALYVNKMAPATTVIAAYTTESNIAADPEKSRLYGAEAAPVSQRVTSGDLYYTLTLVPTQEDAERDGIPYEDYVKLYFEMCDQPWDQISKAQAEHLIPKVNAAKTIRITNDDGTDVRMSLMDELGQAFTCANSVVAKNVPGAEVFTAPRRDSVEGVIVSKGRFATKSDSSKIIENLTLRIEKGQIVDFTAEKGGEHFQEYLDRDPNNAYVGELGIGTNPHLGRHVLNILLVEKIGGSFHLAWGDCYQYTEYEGVPVNVSNGNKTKTGDHWDITTMLRGHGGKMFLDDELVMDNGKWRDPELAVLNEGWGAVPVEQRPNYWKGFDRYDENGNALWSTPPQAYDSKHEPIGHG